MSVKGKSLIKSTTIQGALIAGGVPAIDALLVQFGIIPEPIFTPAITAIVSAAGALIAIWGRIKATQIIKLF